MTTPRYHRSSLCVCVCVCVCVFAFRSAGTIHDEIKNVRPNQPEESLHEEWLDRLEVDDPLGPKDASLGCRHDVPEYIGQSGLMHSGTR